MKKHVVSPLRPLKGNYGDDYFLLFAIEKLIMIFYNRRKAQIKYSHE